MMRGDAIVLKQSPFVFIKLLVIIEILFALIPWLLATVLNARLYYETTGLATTINYTLLTVIVLATLQILILVLAFVGWYVPTYIVDGDKVLFRRGGLASERKLADTQQIREFRVHQGPLARRFDYGAVELFTDAQPAARLTNVADPQGVAERIGAYIDPLLARTDLPPEQTVQEMIAAGEGQFVEFKASLMWDYRQQRANKALYEPVMKNVVGFMNAAAARCIIGVDDDGEIARVWSPTTA